VTRTLEDQIRSLADRSVGAVDPSEGLVPEGAHVPELVDAAGSAAPHRPRTWLVAAVALVVVIGALAAVALWRDPEPQPVTTAPTTVDDAALVAAARELATTVTQRMARPPDGAEAVITTVGRAMASAGFDDPACDVSGPSVVYQFTWNETVTDLQAKVLGGVDPPTGRALQLGRSGPPAVDPAPACGDFLGFTPEPIDLSTLGDPVTVELDPPARGSTPAGWQLDPAVLTVASTTFFASVTRTECASGITGDVGEPIVEMDTSEVVVTFRPPDLPPGPYTCGSNAPTVVEVDLGEPLGDRVLVDGGCLEDGRLPPNLCERWRP
jgi:hypothetical protein